ncbi:MAG: TolC family protein [Chlorobiales bacterium]|nr:TolC family protein [Chlorobiales bacterium]
MAATVLLLLVSGYAGAPAYAQEQNVRRLSLEEALKLAETNNHQVQIAREQLSQAKGQSLEAWNGFLPKVTVSETFVRSNDPVAVFGAKLRQGVFGISDFGGPAATAAFPFDPSLPMLNNPSEVNNFNTAIEVQQPILNFDAILGKSAASAAVSGREYGLKRTEEAISLGIVKVYFGITLAKDKVNAIDQALKSINAYYNEAKAAFDKGLINESDLLSVQVRQAELQEQRMVAENDFRNASDNLRFLLRIEDNVVIEPTDSIAVTESAPQVDVNKPAIERSDIKAMESFENAASRNFNREWMGWLPRINGFARYDWHSDKVLGNDGKNWMLGVMLEWNVLEGLGLGKYGRIQKASAEAEEMRIKYEEAKEKSVVEVRQAMRDLVSAKERVQIAEKSVAQAEASYRIVSSRFREGLERSSELLTKEAMLTNAKLRLLKAKYDHKIAMRELVFYSGSYPATEVSEK